MHIRPMQPSDLSDVSRVAVAAFSDDLYYLRTHPYAGQYPDDFRLFFLRRIKSRTQVPGVHGFVCVADGDDDAWLPQDLRDASRGQVILGYSIWMRHGDESDPNVRQWHQNHRDALSRVNQYLWSWEQSYVDFFGLDRSLDWEAERKGRAASAVSHSFGPLSSHWMLRALATHPSAQRRGVGKLLVRWGMDRARDEGAPVTLHASPNGQLLYRSLGFRVVAWRWTDDKAAQDIHPKMIWDWQKAWVRDVDPDDEDGWVDAPGGVRKALDVAWK